MDQIHRRCEIKNLRHSSHSPDLCHCDFNLFGDLRENMKLLSYEKQLEQAITDAFEWIPRSISTYVSQAWTEKLQQCISNNENYVEQMFSSGPICSKLVLISQVHFWVLLKIKRREWRMSHNLLKPLFRGVTNNLLNTAPDSRASLKIMTRLLKSRGWQFASISLVSDSPKTTIDSYIHFLWNRSVVN
jgi:hypothetical protein